MPKRTLLAVLGGILAFALVVGSAASLGSFTSTTLGSDDAAVASCDTNGVSSSYTNAYDTAPTPGFEVRDVTIAAIADLCDGLPMTITLTNAANASLGSITQSVPVNAAFTNVVDFSGQNVLAESVTGIHVVVTG